MSLTRDTILAADDLPVEVVNVPEWGGPVRVKTMTGAERDAWELSCMRGNEFTKDNIRSRLCTQTIVDDQGQRLFSDADAEALGLKSAKALDAVFTVAGRLNGITDADAEALASD